MSDEMLDYQDPASWDEGEVQKPTKRARAVVSVAFSREDLEQVAETARQHGLKTSEFIRTAALNCVARERSQTVPVVVTGPVQTAHPKIEQSHPRVQIEVQQPATKVYTT